MVLADWWDRVAGRAGKREVFPSRFGEAAVYAMPAEDGSLVRMLNVGGVLQSATYLDERWATCPFAYLRSFDHLFEAALSEAPDPLVVNRVLMLGGAGFAYPKQLLLEHPGVALDVVEIDPAMVQIARERFFLDRLEMQLGAEGRADDLRIFVEDGEAFLRRSDGAPYDAIINDVFVGREAVPFFASDEGIACARAAYSWLTVSWNTLATPCTASSPRWSACAVTSPTCTSSTPLTTSSAAPTTTSS